MISQQIIATESNKEYQMNTCSIKEKLYRTMLNLRSTGLGTKFYYLIEDIGLRIAISRFLTFWMH